MGTAYINGKYFDYLYGDEQVIERKPGSRDQVIASGDAQVEDLLGIIISGMPTVQFAAVVAKKGSPGLIAALQRNDAGRRPAPTEGGDP